MATQNEIVALLNEANAKLKAANERNAATVAIINKIGTETDRLKEQIANLPLPGDATPELITAVSALQTTANTASELAESASGIAAAVDSKVDDAPPA